MGNIAGTYNSATGVMALTSAGSTATVAQWQTAMEAVSYSNTSDTPSTNSRTITYSVNDGATDSVLVTSTISVAALNDAPVIVTATTTLSTLEDTATSFVISTQLSGNVTDADGTALNAIGIWQNTSTNGIWAYSTDGAVTWTNFPVSLASVPNGTGVMYLNATDSLRFTPNANANGTAIGSLDYRAIDATFGTFATGVLVNTNGGYGGSAAVSLAHGYINIDVTAVNDAPINTMPTSQISNEDATKAITALRVADVDDNGGNITVTLTVQNGSIAVLASTGVTITGSGTATVQLVGSKTNLNTALAATNGVVYTPNANYNGSDPLTMTTSDGGNTGAGGALTDTDTVNLVINAVNDVPVLATTSTLAYSENGAATPINTVITVADVDNTTLTSGTVSISTGFVTGQDVLSFTNVPATMGNIAGSYNAATGVMTLTSASSSATVAQWQTAMRAVNYSNTSDAPTTIARTVSYVINDGTANSTALTSTINVTAVNDAPVLSDTMLTLPAVVSNTSVPPDGATTTIGVAVSSLVGGISDADSGALQGIAITGINSAGKLYYMSTSNVWSEITGGGSAVSATNAFVIASSTTINRLYFVPNSGVSGSYVDAFTFRAWDRSVTTVGGVYKDTTTNGTTTEFSAATDTVSQYIVKPVTINAVSTDNIVAPSETLTLSGTADPSATVTLTANSQSFNVTADSSGNWSYDGSKVRYVMVRKSLSNLPISTSPNFEMNGVFSMGELEIMDGSSTRLTPTAVTESSGFSTTESISDNDATTFVETLGLDLGASGGDAWVQVDLGQQL